MKKLKTKNLVRTEAGHPRKGKLKTKSKNLKMSKFLLLCGFTFLLLTFAFSCYAASAIKNVKIANKLYKQGKFDDALQKYNEASITNPDSDIINFDIGTALYKKEDYQKAQESFMKALVSDDKRIETDALYNIGNCKYKLGKLKENTDLSTTVSLMREALEYYKRTIEIDEKNNDARINHELVEKELKTLLDKLKQQGSGSGKQKGQQGDNQQQEQKKDNAGTNDKEQDKNENKENQSAQEQTKQQEEQKKQKQAQEQKQENAKELQQEEEQKQKEENQATRKESEQNKEEKELSEDNARAILERYGQDEATPDYMDKQAQHDYDSPVSKDW